MSPGGDVDPGQPGHQGHGAPGAGGGGGGHQTRPPQQLLDQSRHAALSSLLSGKYTCRDKYYGENEPDARCFIT